ncbi:MAG: hypothetical protein GY869_20270, partial [Planctomycetes bacterium]|nr:hypothetical protein [Planctomycetota bacterium]
DGVGGGGTDGHLTFPTLGQIYFDSEGKVIEIYGAADEIKRYYQVDGWPVEPNVIGEEELREVLRVIYRTPPFFDYVDHFEPQRYIETINFLQRLGEVKAKAAIGEYFRVAAHEDPRDGMSIVFRGLFELPEEVGHMPPLGYYKGLPDPNLLPLYPLVLVKDVPLVFLEGFGGMGGMGPTPEEEFFWNFLEKGKLRDEPLRPTDEPLSLLDEFVKMESLSFGKNPSWNSSNDGKAWVIDQLLYLVSSVYRWDEEMWGNDYHRLDLMDLDDERFDWLEYDEERWQKVVDDFSKLDVRWNAELNKYTFKDGSYLPEAVKPYYRREIWRMEGSGVKAKIILERYDQRYVRVSLEEQAENGDEIKQGKFHVYYADSKKTILVRDDLDVSHGSFDQRIVIDSDTIFRLEVGSKVQVEYEIGGKVVKSEVYIL